MSSSILFLHPSGKRLLLGLMLVLGTGLGACSNDDHTTSGSTTPVTSTPNTSGAFYPPELTTPPFEQLSCAPCGKIVFTSWRDGNAEIYSINADGTELTRLTNNTTHDDSAVWSPDGYRIAFTSGSGLDQELRVMDADGGNIIYHSLPHGVFDPTWAPDGTRITYAAGDDSQDIWTVDADGGWPVLLFSLPNWDGQPAWAPDGTALAVASDWFAYDFVEDVFLVDPDGAAFTALTDADIFDQKNYLYPAWSPDSARITLTLSHRVGADRYINQVGVINRDGSGLRALINGLHGSWSPDGTMIAFTSFGGGANKVGTSNVSWVKADRSAWGTIITDGWNPDWQH